MQELQKNYEVRYEFEHRLLPVWFYGAGKDTLQEIRDQDASFLWSKWKLLCEEKGLGLEDTQNPFRVSKHETDNNYVIVRINMPDPDRELLCHQIYLVWDSDYGHREFITVERGASPEVRYLCSWETGRGKPAKGRLVSFSADELEHSCYGECSPDADEVERSIVDTFIERTPIVQAEKKRRWPLVSAIVGIGAGIVLYMIIKRKNGEKSL